MADLGDGVEGDPPVGGGIRGDDRHPLHPFEGEPSGQLGYRHAPGRILPTGHGHRLVVQQLVGDVRPAVHRRPDGQGAGMEEGPIAEVLDEMGVVGEGEEPVPLGALAAHLGDADRLTPAVGVERRHDVAADAHPDQGVVAGPGGTVVRTSRTEIRGPGGQRRGPHPEALGPVHLGQPAAGRLGEGVPEPGGQHPGHQIAGHGGVVGNQREAFGVALAHHQWRVGLAVEGVFHLGLEEGRLVLDHHHLFETIQHPPQVLGVLRPHHSDLHQADAQRLEPVLVDPEVDQGPEDDGIGEAGGNDPETGPRRLVGHPVQRVVLGVLRRPRESHLDQIPFGHHRLGPDEQ